jgi:7-cyano-7-deazaguanine tRNA-ribosyltransferase
VKSFELLDRDGLGRIGRLATPHGPIETPALLPVVHPDPERQPVPPVEIRRRFGLGAVITSSYITWRTPPLRAVAEARGIHGLLGFDGPVMTDSGAFQQHAYGSVEVGPDEILDFQVRIGSDIPTVLDLFTEPEATFAEAEAGLVATLARAGSARARAPNLLAVPVQGGSYPELRARSAREASELGDVLAVGGVVPLLEQYRFVELVHVLRAARPELSAGAAVHLFGTGHPMTFALAALFGVDLIDSSAYLKFARRGRLLFPEGTVALDELHEPVCECGLCEALPLREAARLPEAERERHLAAHNLLTSATEMARVRQAIRDGTLWELAERRAVAHPALRAALEESRRHPETFLGTEPESRRAFREIDRTSRDRPSVARFREHLERYRSGRPTGLVLPRIPLRPEYLHGIPLRDAGGRPVRWETDTPLGAVPLELTDLYPVGPYLGTDEFLDPPRHRPPSVARAEAHRLLGPPSDATVDWTEEWTRLQCHSLVEWSYGRDVADRLAPALRGERSRSTGRLRGLYRDGVPEFVVGTDGLARPTYRGAVALHPLLPEGKGRVTVQPDAVPFVREGRTLFARFAVRADPALAPGASVLLVDGHDELLAVGRLLLAPHEIPQMGRGVAVRVTAHARSQVPAPDEAGVERPDEPGAPGGNDL